VTLDARYHENDMPTSSAERRRTEAALVRAIDANPDVASGETFSAVCAFVDVLLDEGLLPEAVVIAFKAALARAESLYRVEAETRDQLRAALVSACIQRYFAGRVADDVRITRSPALRLVREDETASLRAPDATA
jgi:hypothetical protein